MIWENFKNNFDESWWPKMKSFIESKECDEIYSFLKEQGRRGVKIVPLSCDTWRCFKETSFSNLKVILLGQSPYATFKEGIPIADGLLMGCSKTNILQPSLQQFYNACERELFNGLALSYKKDPDVTYLAKQGVLMLNAALTTEINKPGSHLLIWEPFMKYLFTEVMSGVNVPIVLLGKDAQKIEKYISPFTHIIKLSHPASASYAKEDWDAKGMFKEINEVLKYNNGESIQWMEEGSDLPF